jgi:AraC-like DNA-binding protein
MPNSFTHLYPIEPSPRARRLLWHLLSIGAVTLDEPDRHEALEKPGAHLFWAQSGKGTLDVPTGSYSLKPGPRCWLVDMRKPRTYAPLPGSRIVNVGLRFGGPELESWREELGEDNAFILAKNDFESIRKATQRMLQLVRRRPVGYEWEVHVQITQILGRLLNTRRVFSSPQLEAPAALRRAVSLVMADPSRDWQVPELAKATGASRSGLQRLFKIHQQESIHEFLQRTRLDRARQLLCDERLAIKEISARLNFSSEFYFSRFFRKKMGMSPRSFRQSIKV